MSRHISIIGGGLAGLCFARQLLAHGYPAQDLSLHHQAMSGVTGSTNPGGLLNPVPGASINPKPGTLRAFQYSMDWIQNLPASLRESCKTDLKLLRPYTLAIQPGRRLFKSFQQSQTLIAQAVGIRHLDLEEVQETYPHLNNCDGAIEFERAATVPMDAVCRYLREDLLKSGVTLMNETVTNLTRQTAHWHIESQTQRVEAESVVLACGPGLLRFFPNLPLRATAGQLSRIRMPADFPQTHAISGRGHLCPMSDGTWIMGATYHQEQALEPQTMEALREILLGKIGHWVQSAHEAEWLESWRGVRAVMTPEKQPLVGAIPSQPGLFTLGGFASRGLQWAPYAAHRLAAHLCGEALDLPSGILSERLGEDGWKLASKPVESPNFAQLGF